MKYLEIFGGSSNTRATLISSECHVGKTWPSPKKEKVQQPLLVSVMAKNVSKFIEIQTQYWNTEDSKRL